MSAGLRMDLILRNVKLRPAMAGLDGSFSQYVAFLQGMDTGSRLHGPGLLEEFPEWLAARTGYGANLPWWSLILIVVFPGWDASRPAGTMSAAEEEAAVDGLFQLLAEFLGIGLEKLEQ
ncbi:hypothetical protein [Streptomyces ficellus]|uniref:Uncharacterized protein n=1 Tax=Streptomyces ficellus TaxID=1977088 RepID=A0A6I6F2X7_9ACTN|nr:hypothetical protein [Streptomyces ficellus]QGV78323.1 hypothetical protein EIZ62_08780 [Streptomyces ficellus]